MIEASDSIHPTSLSLFLMHTFLSSSHTQSLEELDAERKALEAKLEVALNAERAEQQTDVAKPLDQQSSITNEDNPMSVNEDRMKSETDMILQVSVCVCYKVLARDETQKHVLD